MGVHRFRCAARPTPTEELSPPNADVLERKSRQRNKDRRCLFDLSSDEGCCTSAVLSKCFVHGPPQQENCKATNVIAVAFRPHLGGDDAPKINDRGKVHPMFDAVVLSSLAKMLDRFSNGFCVTLKEGRSVFPVLRPCFAS